MAYDVFKKYNLHLIRDSLHESYDDSIADLSWKLIDKKEVRDSDYSLTDYAWYSDGNTHIFMFGDIDITPPDPDYSDWEEDSYKSAKEWFANYTGFDEEYEEDMLETYDENLGNLDFMNDGFDRVYGIGNDNEKQDDPNNSDNTNPRYTWNR